MLGPIAEHVDSLPNRLRHLSRAEISLPLEAQLAELQLAVDPEQPVKLCNSVIPTGRRTGESILLISEPGGECEFSRVVGSEFGEE